MAMSEKDYNKGKTSSTFGLRRVTEMPTQQDEQQWLYTLNHEYQTGAHAYHDLIAANQADQFRLSWVCPGCDQEHRVTGSWIQVITAQQQMLAMGMAVATAVMSLEVADRLEAREVERKIRTGELPAEVASKLDELFKTKPEGEA